MLAAARALLPRLTTQLIGTGFVAEAMRRSANASAWMTGAHGILTVLRLVSNLVLARLLTPEAFGIVAAATIFIGALGLITDIGLGHSVVKSERGEDPAFLQTLFTIQFARSVLNTVLMIVIALVIGLNRDWFPEDSTYALPVTAWVIGAISIKVLFDGLISPSVHLARRRLEQKRVSIVGVATRFIDMPVMFLAAWAGFGAWSLVLGQFANVLVMVVASHTYLSGPRMKFAFEREAFREIFSYGKWLLIASLATIVIQKGGEFIFSAAFSVRDFSLFVVAGIWIGAIKELVNKIINSVAFAAISETMRRERHAVPRVYKRFRLLSDVVVMAAFVAVMIGYDWFFDLFYPPDFEQAKAFVPFISLSLLFVPYMILQQVSLAAGDSFNFMWIKVAAAVGIITVVPSVLHFFGEMPAVLALSAISIVTVPPSLLTARRHMKLDLATEIRLPIATVLAGGWIVLTQL